MNRENARIGRVVADQSKVVDGERNGRSRDVHDGEDRVHALTDGIPVRRRRCDAAHAHDAARTGAIDENQRRSEKHRQLRLDHADSGIDGTAGRRRHDHLDRARRIRLLRRGRLDRTGSQDDGARAPQQVSHRFLLRGEPDTFLQIIVLAANTATVETSGVTRLTIASLYSMGAELLWPPFCRRD
jgi:hypothetical protein